MVQWLFGFVALATVAQTVAAEQQADAFLWLEDVTADRSMEWVAEMNRQTAEAYKSQPIYQQLYQEALQALNNKTRIPQLSQRGKWLYNYWKDAANPRGVYRRIKLQDFKQGRNKWQTVLDMDKYNSEHDGSWTFNGMSCLSPEYRHCLAFLSPGGTDSTVMREFDMKKLTFVKGGFELPNSKMRVAWRDKNNLFVATDFGQGSMTESGYPRILKSWERGKPLSAAKTLMEISPKSIWINAYHSGEGADSKEYISEGLTFWSSKNYQLVDGEAKPLALPETAVIEGDYQGKLLVSLKQDWTFQGKLLSKGNVLLINPDILTGKTPDSDDWQVFLQPPKNGTIESISSGDDSIVVTMLEDVVGIVKVFKQDEQGNWNQQQVALPDNGAIGLMSLDEKSGDFFARYESFLVPPTLYFVDGKTLKPQKVSSQSPSFDAAPYQVKQYFARSKDGTAVPYFVVMNKQTKFDGSNPTHIFAYGGFRNSVTPSYSGSYEALEGAYGNMWLARGGVFVSASIRGGGEYGPDWHQSALLENRHKAFEDFEAVAEDLIERKITSPEKLSIEGRSNGGLLVGATMTRRPDLYNAVICGVPLLDMKRYNKLLAGASWVGEYGNPDIPEQWQYIKQYSPYQNLQKDTDYPAVFFYTSTKDDRVHPGHARKMAAKMKSYGYPVWYYENTEGGHKGSSTNEQLAERLALAFTHLWLQSQ